MPPKKGNGGGQKKKKVTGPQRGFSTVSIVSKKEVVIEDEVIPGAVETQVASLDGLAEQIVKVEDETWSPEAMEKHDLQVLMDNVRRSSSKEISLVMKAVEYERRMAKTYPLYVWADGKDLVRPFLPLCAGSC